MHFHPRGQRLADHGGGHGMHRPPPNGHTIDSRHVGQRQIAGPLLRVVDVGMLLG